MDNNKTVEAKVDYSVLRIWRWFILNIQRWFIFPSSIRVNMCKWGVMIEGQCYIGTNVSFDTLRPDLIKIGRGSIITSGTKIITHFYKPSEYKMFFGAVVIGENVFIGMNTLIINAVNIGSNAVIGAGSVVLHDIGIYEIWGGNPAKFIKKR